LKHKISSFPTWQADCLLLAQEANMTWLYNMLNDLQKRIAGESDEAQQGENTLNRLREHRTSERVRQFQARLHALDRRLAALR
jgi:hypothetical protein